MTARGSCTGLVTVGPTKVFKASKSVLSTKDPSVVKMKEYYVDEVKGLPDGITLWQGCQIIWLDA